MAQNSQGTALETSLMQTETNVVAGMLMYFYDDDEWHPYHSDVSDDSDDEDADESLPQHRPVWPVQATAQASAADGDDEPDIFADDSDDDEATAATDEKKVSTVEQVPLRLKRVRFAEDEHETSATDEPGVKRVATIE